MKLGTGETQNLRLSDFLLAHQLSLGTGSLVLGVSPKDASSVFINLAFLTLSLCLCGSGLDGDLVRRNSRVRGLVPH